MGKIYTFFIYSNCHKQQKVGSEITVLRRDFSRGQVTSFSQQQTSPVLEAANEAASGTCREGKSPQSCLTWAEEQILFLSVWSRIISDEESWVRAAKSWDWSPGWWGLHFSVFKGTASAVWFGLRIDFGNSLGCGQSHWHPPLPPRPPAVLQGQAGKPSASPRVCSGSTLSMLEMSHCPPNIWPTFANEHHKVVQPNAPKLPAHSVINMLCVFS